MFFYMINSIQMKMIASNPTGRQKCPGVILLYIVTVGVCVNSCTVSALEGFGIWGDREIGKSNSGRLWGLERVPELSPMNF